MDAFRTEIFWSRLGAAVDEAAIALIRTAFSGVVRDNRDFACGLFDAKARLLAQDSLGTPGLSGSLPGAMKHFLAAHPPETLAPGDVLITNDPWKVSGHLNDLTVLTPFFVNDRVAGYAMCIAHLIDIGGRGMTTEARDVHEEGLFVPILKLIKAGQPNEELWALIAENVRTPDMVLGDIRAQLSSNDICGRHLAAVVQEIGIEGLSDLAENLAFRTEKSMRTAIAAIPDGDYRATLELDSRPDRSGRNGGPLYLRVLVKVKGDEIVVDFEGTSPQVSVAINSPLNGLTTSYTLMGLKSMLDPLMPINDGFLRPITITAPSGCLVNPNKPAPVRMRTQVAHFLPELLFTAMSAAIPGQVIAPSGTVPAWNQQLNGTRSDGKRFAHFFPVRGGLGARPDRDGISCLSFPTNVSTLQIELLEADAPIIVEKKEILMDSAGPGKYRGGCGQEVLLRVLEGELAPHGPLELAIQGGRFEFDIPGFHGGGSARSGHIEFNDEPMRGGKLYPIASGDRVLYRTPGGGGFYPPWERSPERVVEDVRAGYVSVTRAREDYGVVLDETFTVDLEETLRERSRLRSAE